VGNHLRTQTSNFADDADANGSSWLDIDCHDIETSEIERGNTMAKSTRTKIGNLRIGDKLLVPTGYDADGTSKPRVLAIIDHFYGPNDWPVIRQSQRYETIPTSTAEEAKMSYDRITGGGNER